MPACISSWLTSFVLCVLTWGLSLFGSSIIDNSTLIFSSTRSLYTMSAGVSIKSTFSISYQGFIVCCCNFLNGTKPAFITAQIYPYDSCLCSNMRFKQAAGLLGQLKYRFNFYGNIVWKRAHANGT